MIIGIVLAKTPGYSETFFNSKIKGLQENGFQVILFVKKIEKNFSLCKQKEAPKFFSNPVIQFSSTLLVLASLFTNLKPFLKFIKIGRKENLSFLEILKKIYLNSHILKHKVDWLHFGFATQTLGSELVAKAIGAKMAVSFRGFDIAIYPLKHPKCYNLSWKHLDKVHTISDDLLKIAYQLGLPKNIPVKKITPAIDTCFFKNENKTFLLPKVKTKILSVARLNWKKGFIEVIKALQILKSKKIDFEYTIVGEGDQYERIAFAIKQLGLQENVYFLGKKSREEVVNLYKQSHIFIQYSISEGFCNAVLEAQSMGLLTIVSNAEGLPENIEHNITGWLVPKYNPEALAKKIEEVVHLPEEIKQDFSNKAQKRVKQYFTIEQQHEKFVEFYRN